MADFTPSRERENEVLHGDKRGYEYLTKKKFNKKPFSNSTGK